MEKGESGNLYEERITLWQAGSFEEAITKAEKEAIDYARFNGCQYLEYAAAYILDLEFITEGSEVYSLMRGSMFKPDAYISTFMDTGRERQTDCET